MEMSETLRGLIGDGMGMAITIMITKYMTVYGVLCMSLYVLYLHVYLD